MSVWKHDANLGQGKYKKSKEKRKRREEGDSADVSITEVEMLHPSALV